MKKVCSHVRFQVQQKCPVTCGPCMLHIAYFRPDRLSTLPDTRGCAMCTSARASSSGKHVQEQEKRGGPCVEDQGGENKIRCKGEVSHITRYNERAVID